MIITKDHKLWADRIRHRPIWYKSEYRNKEEYRNADFWIKIIEEQKGKCALTEAPLLFDVRYGTARKKQRDNSFDHLVHPLYASVDHVKPGCDDAGFQILCFDINDLKHNLSIPLMNGLKKSGEWKIFKVAWQSAAEKAPYDIEIFKRLIKEGF